MAKIAYNACYGGFGLSDKAITRYAELKNLALYPQPTKWGGAIHYLAPPTGDKNADDRRKYLCGGSDLERDDPVLIQVIEELGDEANGSWLDDMRDELAEQFADLASDPSAETDDFDRVLSELYDWADTPLDSGWNGKKVCWIATF